ncbi:MAG: hypothetical protein M1824_003308 [Vezdaea acicularis]|nr:MAG: hypothetical protein M1824_003308 [Vezdaea acicularis]
MSEGPTTIWRPGDVLSSNLPITGDDFALLILNQPISSLSLLKSLVTRAEYIIAADGGANRLYAAFPEQVSLDCICGDLDSIDDEVRDHYEKRGVEIIQDSDQYSTDFTKCLRNILQHCIKLGYDSLNVVVLGGLGGRVDQAFSQLHTMYETVQDNGVRRGRIFLVSQESVSFFLERGKNLVLTPKDVFKENVGIIPLGPPAVISTKGLEWDVNDWETQIGKQISTSNHIRADVLEIETNERVLFTIELAQA